MTLNKISIKWLVSSWVKIREIVGNKVLEYSSKVAHLIQDNPFTLATWWWLMALWLSASLASASIPEKHLANEIRMWVDTINIYPVTSGPVMKQDWEYLTINPDTFWKTPNTLIKNMSSTGSATLGSSIIDALAVSQELQDGIKQRYSTDAKVFAKALTRQESHSWDTMFSQLDLAKDSQDISTTKRSIWRAIRSIQWISAKWVYNAVGLWQITPQFWPLKEVKGPVVTNGNKLKTLIYWVLLHYANPSLFYSTINDTKTNSSHTITLLNKAKTHIENYLRENNKAQINKEDIFAILSWIDVRFDNQKMWEIILQYFVDEYDRLLVTKTHLSQDEIRKLVLNRYNGWNNATIEASYASSVLSHAKRIAKLNPVLFARKNPTDTKEKPLSFAANKSKPVESQLPKFSDSKPKTSFEANVGNLLQEASNNTPQNTKTTVQLIHYTNEIANVILASRNILSWSTVHKEKLKKVRGQLRAVDSLINQLCWSTLKENFVKAKLEQLWNIKYDLMRQIAELETIANQVKWSDAYKYGLAV